MNGVHAKNNNYKNLIRSGNYKPDYSKQMARERAASILPSAKQKHIEMLFTNFALRKGL